MLKTAGYTFAVVVVVLVAIYLLSERDRNLPFLYGLF